MRTIIIEPVSNGWIIKYPHPDTAICGQEVAAFNRWEDLCRELPGLIEAEINYSHVSVLPPALATLDSDGGNTGL